MVVSKLKNNEYIQNYIYEYLQIRTLIMLGKYGPLFCHDLSRGPGHNGHPDLSRPEIPLNSSNH